MNAHPSYQCLVVGGGPAGLAAAGCLASKGVEVAVATGRPAADPTTKLSQYRIGPAPIQPPAGITGQPPALAPASHSTADTRTAALFPPAIALIHALDAWRELAATAAPIRAIRIVDGTGNLLRAPEVTFAAADIDLDNLGHNIQNAALASALETAARSLGVAILDDTSVTGLTLADDHATVALAGGHTLRARLVVGADGRTSICRTAAGIDARHWHYDQAAIACTFEHTRPHRGISTEVHGTAGPCTTVPLPGNASSLVWMERPHEAERLRALPPADFIAALETRLGGLLGDITTLGPRRTFPLAGLIADPMARRRVALVGEAGHALPPIGAQGLNLGLTDAAVLADCVADARKSGRDIGGDSVIDAYARARSADVHRRVGAVDLLSRSLDPAFLPLGLARGAGLHALAASKPLRRRLMREGLYPPEPLPTMMR